MKVYQIVLKYKNNGKQEVVGEASDREKALAAKDHYNQHEDNTNIYYIAQSVTIPTAVKRKVNK